MSEFNSMDVWRAETGRVDDDEADDILAAYDNGEIEDTAEKVRGNDDILDDAGIDGSDGQTHLAPGDNGGTEIQTTTTTDSGETVDVSADLEIKRDSQGDAYISAVGDPTVEGGQAGGQQGALAGLNVSDNVPNMGSLSDRQMAAVAIVALAALYGGGYL
jgi:hypothetical protein